MLELEPIPLPQKGSPRSWSPTNFSRGRGIKPSSISSPRSNRNSYSPISIEQFNQRAPDRREKKKRGTVALALYADQQARLHRGHSTRQTRLASGRLPTPSRLVLVRLRGPSRLRRKAKGAEGKGGTSECAREREGEKERDSINDQS